MNFPEKTMIKKHRKIQIEKCSQIWQKKIRDREPRFGIGFFAALHAPRGEVREASRIGRLAVLGHGTLGFLFLFLCVCGEASKEAEKFAELQGLDKRDLAIAIVQGNLKRSLKFR